MPATRKSGRSKCPGGAGGDPEAGSAGPAGSLPVSLLDLIAGHVVRVTETGMLDSTTKCRWCGHHKVMRCQCTEPPICTKSVEKVSLLLHVSSFRWLFPPRTRCVNVCSYNGSCHSFLLTTAAVKVAMREHNVEDCMDGVLMPTPTTESVAAFRNTILAAVCSMRQVRQFRHEGEDDGDDDDGHHVRGAVIVTGIRILCIGR